jgi:hypothetical protein
MEVIMATRGGSRIDREFREYCIIPVLTFGLVKAASAFSVLIGSRRSLAMRLQAAICYGTC